MSRSGNFASEARAEDHNFPLGNIRETATASAARGSNSLSRWNWRAAERNLKYF